MSVSTPILTTLSDMPSARAANDPIATTAANETASTVRQTHTMAYLPIDLTSGLVSSAFF
jgi:hypothetical protein